MTCIHLQRLYQLCQDEELRLGSSDLIRIVCQQCGVQDVCPSLLIDEYEARNDAEGGEQARSASAGSAAPAAARPAE